MGENLVALVSRVNYPVTVKYGDEVFVLPHKKKTKKEFIRSKLKDIDPKEITILR